MTDPAQPATHTHPAEGAAPRRLRLAVGLLALLVGVGFGMLLWLWLGPFHAASVQRHRLACQVQQLGGEPVGGVHCPPTKTPQPHASRGRTTRPTPQLTAAPTSTVVVVRPRAPRAHRTRTTTGPRSSPSGHPSHRPPTSKPTPLACVTAGPLDACLHKPAPLVDGEQP